MLAALAILALIGGALFFGAGALEDHMFPPQPAVDLAAQPRCEAAVFDTPADVRILGVSLETSPEEHCRVTGVIETEINFELLLPLTWNGKFVMGGGGGFVGSVVNTAYFYGALQSGYATVGTDTGHRGHAVDASWALDNPERVENFGHRAVHLTAVASKQLITSFYGQPSRLNYFMGCSRGGGQALMEAQRYPADFDGIVAGAPAYNWTMGIGANATQITQAQYPDPLDLEEALITPADQALIAQTYLAQCDALDGIEDGILIHPPACDFDVDSLRCDGSRSPCLEDAKIAAMQRIYRGPVIDGESVWPGFPLGGETSEGGMSVWLTGGMKYFREARSELDSGAFPAPRVPSASFGFGTGVMKYLIFNDPDWDYATYDFDGFAEISESAAEILNATDADLSPFRERGGKLLMYHGWSDMALSAYATIDYYDEMLAGDPSAGDDVRLYLMPGVDHCFGGAGPSFVNFLTEIDRWVEGGEPPGAMEARWLRWRFLPAGSRIICPYPQQVRYNGSGDTRDAASFHCAIPESP